MKMGRTSLGASNRGAGVAVLGDLRWKKLKGRDEGKRLEVLEEVRLVKKW